MNIPQRSLQGQMLNELEKLTRSSYEKARKMAEDGTLTKKECRNCGDKARMAWNDLCVDCDKYKHQD